MVADLLGATTRSAWLHLLLCMDAVLTGIDIDYDPPFVSTPNEGVGRSAEHIF